MNGSGGTEVTDAVRDFPHQFARTRRFSLGLVRSPVVASDGTRVLFLRTGGGRDPVGRLWVQEGGTERLLADPYALGGIAQSIHTAQSARGTQRPVHHTAVSEVERARRERTREQSIGITAFASDTSARLSAFTLGGALWAVRTEDAEPYSVPAAGPAADPRPSPDGRWIAYVTGGALHAVRADGTGDIALAEPESPDVTYGLADYVAAESMGRMRGFWWAPDGSALLAARADVSPVGRRWISDPSNPARRPRMVRYPAAGTPNAEVSLWLFGLDGSRTQVRWDDETYEYVAAAGWDGHGPLVTVQSRDQRTVRTLAVDPDSGTTRLLHEQRDPHWVALVPGSWCRTASGALVGTHDSAHSYDADGTYDGGSTRRLHVGGDVVSPPGLQVTEVLGTHGEQVLFRASEDPTEEHVWRYTPAHGCVQISTQSGVHTAAAGGDTLVLDSLTPTGQRVTVLHDGMLADTLASREEKPSVPPRPLFLALGERALRSTLFLPSWYAPGAPGAPPLPVLLDPYAGPGMRLVLRARLWQSSVSQWFAEHGFAVLVTDGRGTPGRGPAWEKAVHGDQLTPALEDQIDALHTAAATRPCMDLDRVAIRGWSFSGTLAAAAVMRHPDIFHAAVAGAAPSDQRLYDTHWKERYLGHPAEEPDNYSRSSLLDDAPSLRRPLLLIHGTADDNVAFAHLLRLSAALLNAGREHSVLPLSGQSHTVGSGVTAEQLLHHQLHFLHTSLPPRGR